MRSRCLGLVLCAVALAGCRSRHLVPDMRIEGNVNLLDADLVSSAERYLDRYLANDRRPADADDAAYAMQTRYREEGYAEAVVRFEITGRELVFLVEEGPLAKLGRIRFEGVKSVPVCDLLALFDFEGSGFLSLGPVLLEPHRVASAVSGVESVYHAAGFLRVEVAEPEIQWNADRTIADVVVRVEEGRKYTVSSVEVAGALRSSLGPPDAVGGPYRGDLPARLASRLLQWLRAEGYAFAEVEASSEIDDDTATARIRLEAVPGELTRLDGICFSGSRATRTGFMRRRFSLRQGDVIRRDRLEAGVADLYRSRLFNSVQAEVVPTTPGRARLDVQVEGADTKRLDLEGGWGSWDQLYGAFRYADFNLFGAGRVLRLSGLASMKSYGGEVEVEDPWILGQDNRIWVTLGALQREDRFYDYTSFKAAISVEHRFDRHMRLLGGYELSIEEATHLTAALPPEVLEEISGFQRRAGPYVRFRYDRRDDLFTPTTGWITEASAFWSTPVLGASLSFVELDVRGSAYVDLTSWGVLAVGAGIGSRNPYDGTVMPIQQRYFLGGPQSVRSFDFQELTPTDPFGNGIGGLTFAEVGVEWRRRLIGLLHGALFFDAGQVSLDPWSFAGEIGYGIGAGLRAYTPVGPVRLDAAYNPGPLLGASQRWQLHFAFGFSF